MRKLTWVLSLLVIVFCQVGFAASWEDNKDISGGLSANGDSVIVADKNGNAAAIWQDSGSGKIVTSYRPVGGLWSPIESLGAGEPNPDISVDENGNLRAVWVQTGGVNIQTATRSFGGSWSGASTITAGNTNADHVNIEIVSNSGYAAVVWTSLPGANNVVRAATWDGAAWTINNLNIPADIIVDGASDPIVHVLPTGEVIAAYIGEDTGTNIRDVYYTNGNVPAGTWSPVVASGFPEEPAEFDFDMNLNGEAVIGSTGSTTNRIDAIVRNSSVWSSSTNVTMVPSKEVKVGIDKFKIITVVYRTTFNAIEKASTQLPTVAFPSFIISPAGNNFNHVRFDVSEAGGMVVSYLDFAGVIYAQVGFSGTFEATPTSLNAMAKNESVAMSDAGIAFAIWKDTTGNGFIEGSRTIINASQLIKVLGKKRLIYQKGLYP